MPVSHLLQHLLWGIGLRMRKRHDERGRMTTHELWKACSCPTRPYKVSARVSKASRSLTILHWQIWLLPTVLVKRQQWSLASLKSTSPARSRWRQLASEWIPNRFSHFRICYTTNRHCHFSPCHGVAIGDRWTSHSEPKPITSVLWLGGLWMWFKSCFWGIVASTCPPFSIEPTLYPTRILFHVRYISHVLRNPKKFQKSLHPKFIHIPFLLVVSAIWSYAMLHINSTYANKPSFIDSVAASIVCGWINDSDACKGLFFFSCFFGSFGLRATSLLLSWVIQLSQTSSFKFK